MHNSQAGASVTFDGNPHDMLLLGDCMGCHSNTTTDTIKTPLGSDIPQVWNTAGGTTDPGTSQSWSGLAYNLAGGNFYYVVSGPTNAKGHNIQDMVAADGNFPPGNVPPGYEASHDTSSVKWNTTYQLTCAGSNGCHGDRNEDRNIYGAGAGTGWSASLKSLKGAHHEDDSTITGATVGKSYRFLKGILGKEDSDWQQSASINDHNEYQGASDQVTATTISYLCGQCHGIFHDQLGGPSPWLRHPTDTDVIAKGGEYANYNPDPGPANNYSLEAPVGYIGAIPAVVRSTVSSGNSPVICLSCHRAHASPYDDILRWNYAGMEVGSGTADKGCFTCHTAKNAD
jgi:hypothetical protein